VNLGVLELVFVVGVEDDAVLVQEAVHRRLPPRRPQESYDYVEEPVLSTTKGK
jgi:hypothetical protein